MKYSIIAAFASCRRGNEGAQTISIASAAFIVLSVLGSSNAFGEVPIDRSVLNTVADYDAQMWSDLTYDVSARPLIVTSSDPPNGGDRVATPGVPVAGIDLDGVGQLIADVVPEENLVGVCSASLVGDGSQALTAAHCVTAPDGTPNVIDGVDGNGVVFDTPGGPVVATFEAADVTRHPSYDGNALHGFDVAVINFNGPLDPSLPRYMLNTDSVGIVEAAPHLSVGYGESGDGNTGATIPVSLNQTTKRSGGNQFETIGLGAFGVSSITNSDTQLTADFDSGLAANDAFDFFFALSNLGFNADEVGTAPGDSGGPSLTLVDGVPKIIGVHSYGLRLNFTADGSSSDIDDVLNSSFGEFMVDARVAHPEILAWLQQVIVPEPSTLWLVVLAGMVGWTRRVRNCRS